VAEQDSTSAEVPRPSRHPKVTWWNAINGASHSRCFATLDEAWDAAVTERPYNNARLDATWCDEPHYPPALGNRGGAA
jgi:hypothetical protein